MTAPNTYEGELGRQNGNPHAAPGASTPMPMHVSHARIRMRLQQIARELGITLPSRRPNARDAARLAARAAADAQRG